MKMNYQKNDINRKIKWIFMSTCRKEVKSIDDSEKSTHSSVTAGNPEGGPIEAVFLLFPWLWV